MVSGSAFLRGPVGPDAHRRPTFPAERTLVVAARTVTSTARVLESLPALLHDDPRVNVVSAHDATCAFASGVLDLLHTSGCRVVPWEQLVHFRAGLVRTASENVDVPEGDCRVLVLPHGVGFQRWVPDARGPHERLSGLVPDALLTSSLVITEVGEEGFGPVVTVRRFPAAARAHVQVDLERAQLLSFTHFGCSDGERDRRLLESASVVERTDRAGSAAEALRWIRATAAELPGSLPAACAVRGGGHLVGLRDGRVVGDRHRSVDRARARRGRRPRVPAPGPFPGRRVAALRIGEVRDEDVALRLRLRPAPPVVG